MGNCTSKSSAKDVVSTPRKDELKEGAFKYNKDNRQVVYVGDDNRDDNITARASISASASASITSEESSPINPQPDSASKSLLGEIREYLEDDASTQVTARRGSPAQNINQHQDRNSDVSSLSKEHGGAILSINRGLAIVSPLPFEGEHLQTDSTEEDDRDDVKIAVNDDSTLNNLTIEGESLVHGPLSESLKKAQALLGEVSERRDREITKKMTRTEEVQSVEIVNVLSTDCPGSANPELVPTPEHETTSGIFSYDTDCDEEAYWKDMQSGTESVSVNSEDEKMLTDDRLLPKDDNKDSHIKAVPPAQLYSFDNNDRDKYLRKDTIQLAPTAETEVESLDEIINSEELNGGIEDDDSIDTSEWSESMTELIKLCEEESTPKKGKRGNASPLPNKRHVMFNDSSASASEEDVSLLGDLPDSSRAGLTFVADLSETSIKPMAEKEAEERPKNSPSIPTTLQISQDTLASINFSPLAAPQEIFLAQEEVLDKAPISSVGDSDATSSPKYEDSKLMMAKVETKTLSKSYVLPQGSFLAEKEALEKTEKTPNTVVKTPNTVVKTSKTMVKTPNTVVKKPNTVVKKPNTVVKKPNTVVKKTNTELKTPKTVVNTSKTIVKTPEIVVKTPKKVVSENSENNVKNLSKSPVLPNESIFAGKDELEKIPKAAARDNNGTSSYSGVVVAKEVTSQISSTTDVVCNSTTATTKVVNESLLPDTAVNLVRKTNNSFEVTNEKPLQEVHMLSPSDVNMEPKVTDEVADSITRTDEKFPLEKVLLPSPSDVVKVATENLPDVTEEVVDSITTTDRRILSEKSPLSSPLDMISVEPKLATENSSDVRLNASEVVAEGKESVPTSDEPETVKCVVEEKPITPDTLLSMSSDSDSASFAIHEKEEILVSKIIPVSSTDKNEGKSAKKECPLLSLPIDDDTKSSSQNAILPIKSNVTSTDSNTTVQQSGSPTVAHSAKVSSQKSKLQKQSSNMSSSSVTRKKTTTSSKSQHKQSTTSRLSTTLKSSSKLSSTSPRKKISALTAKSPLTPTTRKRVSSIPKVKSPAIVRSPSPYNKSARRTSIPSVSSPSVTPSTRRNQQESPFSGSKSSLKSPARYKSLTKIRDIDDVPFQIMTKEGTPGEFSLDTDSTTPASTPWDEPSTKSLSVKKTKVTRCSSPVESEIESTAESILSYSSHSSKLVRKRQISTQNRITQYKSPKACSERWNPSLYRSKRPCARCHSIASEKEKQKFELNGHSTTITLTSGGCTKSCRQFLCPDNEDGVCLCRICFNAVHRPARILIEEACRSLEY